MLGRQYLPVLERLDRSVVVRLVDVAVYHFCCYLFLVGTDCFCDDGGLDDLVDVGVVFAVVAGLMGCEGAGGFHFGCG